MDKRLFATIVGGTIAYCICGYLRARDEEKRLKEIDDMINKSTEDLMDKVNKDMMSMHIFIDKNIEETKETQDRLDDFFKGLD